MKKVFLYLFSILFLGSVLSSCLGDSGSSYESSGYGVVNMDGDTKVMTFVISNSIYSLTAPNLSNYNNGDIAKANFKVDFNNVSGTGTYYSADYIDIVEQDVYTDAEQQTIRMGVVPEILSSYQLKALSVNMPIITDYQLNKSLLSYSYSVKPGQRINGLVFYYDAGSQTDVASSANTFIIDVRLNIEGSGTGTETTTFNASTGVDFSSFKQLVKPSTIASTGTYINIWFRYYPESTSETPTVTLLKTTGTQIFYTGEAQAS